MVTVLIWVVLSVVVGWAGAQKGRSGGGFFLLSLLLSPLIGILVVIAVPRVERSAPPSTGKDLVVCRGCRQLHRADEPSCPRCGIRKVDPRDGQKKCPACAEWILAEAKKCKHCGEMQPEPSAPRPRPALDPPRWDKVDAIERDLDQRQR